MTLLNKIGHVLTVDITKDFKLKKKLNHDGNELTFIDQFKKRLSKLTKITNHAKKFF